MNLFTCPTHRSNDHTLDRCGSVKRFFAIFPDTNSTPGGSTCRGGGSGTHDSDGGCGRGSGRGYQRRSDSDSNTDAARRPPAPPPTSSRQSMQLGTVAKASVPSVMPPPNSTPAASVPAALVPDPAPVGAGFAESIYHNRFATLASPTHMFNPATPSTTEQAATVDLDFTFEFATSQGIPPTLSNHSKPALKMYIRTACQSDMTSTPSIPPSQETCLSTAKYTQPVQVDTSHIGIADSGTTDHIFREKTYFLTYTPVHGTFIMMANGASIPFLGMGTFSLSINGIPVKLIHCYHTPGL
jgi:hypothetical protein